MRKGLTLIELMISVVMLAILVIVLAFIFRAVLLSWSSQEKRAGIDISLDWGIEQAVRDLRQAKSAQAVNNDEIRFTQDNSNFYIYYLYNTSETYPPSFSQSAYQLRKATLSGGITGTFTYGSGQFIITDVLPPPASDLSIASNLVTLDLSVKRGDETIRTRTQVRPRNL